MLSVLFNLLLANITILLCFFFLSFFFFNSFFLIPGEIKNARPQFTPSIPTIAPITIVNNAIEMLLVPTDKTINDLSK